MDWTDWRMVADDGTIPPELLPAVQWQYKWVVDHEFSIPRSPGVQMGTINITMEFRARYGQHLLHDRAVFTAWHQADPLDPFVTSWYTYWLGVGETTVEEGTAERRGGATTGQVVFVYKGPSTAMGIMRGFIMGDLLGDIWTGPIAAHEKVEFVKWFPSSNVPNRKQLWMRTRRGAPPMQTLLDGPTANKHELWTEQGMLLCRMQFERGAGHDGLRVGGLVQWAQPNVLAVQGGEAIIGQQRVFWAPTYLPVTAPTMLVLLVAGGNGGAMPIAHPVTSPRTPLPYPHTCIARVAGGSIDQGAKLRGTVVSMDAEDFSAWQEDDGTLHAHVGPVDKRVRMVSRDRGARWTATTTAG